jgi:hypothetical protein
MTAVESLPAQTSAQPPYAADTVDVVRSLGTDANAGLTVFAPSHPVAAWVSDYLCSSRGCGGQVHTLCVEGAERPNDDAMFTYVCPVTRRPTGFRFGDLEWRTVPTCPAGSVVARGKGA